MKVDFTVQYAGSIFILHIQTKAAKQWVADNLHDKLLTWGKDGVVVDSRYIGDIVLGIESDGLVVR